MMFPKDFDILRPSASMMWPRQTTCLYGLSPNTNVLTASNE